MNLVAPRPTPVTSMTLTGTGSTGQRASRPAALTPARRPHRPCPQSKGDPVWGGSAPRGAASGLAATSPTEGRKPTGRRGAGEGSGGRAQPCPLATQQGPQGAQVIMTQRQSQGMLPGPMVLARTSACGTDAPTGTGLATVPVPSTVCGKASLTAPPHAVDKGREP